MPMSFRSLRLWTLVAVLVIAVVTGTALRATQSAATPDTHWPRSAAI